MALDEFLKRGLYPLVFSIFIIITMGEATHAGEGLLKDIEFCEISKLTRTVVQNCPKDIAGVMEAANRKNCSAIKSTCIGRLEYHCVINPWGNLTVEVCAPATNISRRSCTEYNEGGGRIQENSVKTCGTCMKKYLSTNSYKYQECYPKLNTEDHNLPYARGNGELFHNATKFVEKSRNRSQLFQVPSTNIGFKSNTFGVIYSVMIQMLLIVLL